MGTPEFTPIYSLDNKCLIAGNVYENYVSLYSIHSIGNLAEAL